MGLINWFKDKVILSLEHDVKMLESEVKSIRLDFERLEDRFRSLQGSFYRSRRNGIKDDDDEEPTELQQGDLEFLRSLPEYEKARLPENIKKML